MTEDAINKDREKSAGKRAWTSRSIGSRFQHQIFYAIIRLGGRHLAFFVLRFVVAWYVLVRPSVRERCSYYLRRRFPEDRGFKFLRNCYRLSFSLGKVLVDRAVLGILGPDKINCRLAGFDHLRALLSEGRGLILVTSHVGCWQLGMSCLRRLNVPVSLLIHREAGDVDRHHFEHSEEASPYRFIDPCGYLGGTLEMLQVLKNKEVLCIMGDRVMGGPGSNVPVEFLGSTIPVPFSPYKLASASGAPIAVLFPYQSDADEYSMLVTKVIRVPENLGRGAVSHQPYAKEYIAALEGFVKDHPYQFFNFFDMWAETPARPES
jgi:predicted LPLAT superfamily acyltransferase